MAAVIGWHSPAFRHAPAFTPDKKCWIDDTKDVLAELDAKKEAVFGALFRDHSIETHRILVTTAASAKLEDTLPRTFQQQAFFEAATSRLANAWKVIDAIAPERRSADLLRIVVDGQLHNYDTEWEADGDKDATAKQAQAQMTSHAKACLFMHVAARWELRLTPELLCLAHSLLMNGAKDMLAGAFRTGPVNVGTDLITSDPDKILAHVTTLCTKIEDDLATKSPYEVAAKALHRLLQIHPFMNGNGRLARTLFAYCLTRKGYPVPVIFSSGNESSRRNYYFALQKADMSKFDEIIAIACESVAQSWCHLDRIARE
jgi:fido (protein-threonine AMPylation protein)